MCKAINPTAYRIKEDEIVLNVPIRKDVPIPIKENAVKSGILLFALSDRAPNIGPRIALINMATAQVYVTVASLPPMSSRIQSGNNTPIVLVKNAVVEKSYSHQEKTADLLGLSKILFAISALYFAKCFGTCDRLKSI